MSEGNFSVGDVVVCVDDVPRPHSGKPWPLVRNQLYEVSAVGFSADDWPSVELKGVPIVHACPCGCFSAYASDRFRLAFKPDPEVARETTKTPVRHKEPAR